MAKRGDFIDVNEREVRRHASRNLMKSQREERATSEKVDEAARNEEVSFAWQTTMEEALENCCVRALRRRARDDETHAVHREWRGRDDYY